MSSDRKNEMPAGAFSNVSRYRVIRSRTDVAVARNVERRFIHKQ